MADRGADRGAPRLAVAGLIALTLVAFLWEWILAPLRPGGSWLVLKSLPLALLVPSALSAPALAATIAHS